MGFCPTLKWASSARSLAGQWWHNIECRLGSFVIFQGIRTSIAKKPYMNVIFQGCAVGSGTPATTPPPPSGSAPVCVLHQLMRFCYLSHCRVAKSQASCPIGQAHKSFLSLPTQRVDIDEDSGQIVFLNMKALWSYAVRFKRYSVNIDII